MNELNKIIWAPVIKCLQIEGRIGRSRRGFAVGWTRRPGGGMRLFKVVSGRNSNIIELIYLHSPVQIMHLCIFNNIFVYKHI
jgi:hypothetical protein